MAIEMNQQPGWGQAASGPGFTAPGAPQNPGAVRPDPRLGPPAPQPYAPYGPGLPAPAPAPTPPPQRPGVVTVSLVMTVTASMLWMAALALVWMVVAAARTSFGYEGAEGAIFHMLERFHLKMLGGLAFVLFGFPLAATVMAFFLLARRAWPRIVVSVLGVLAIGTTAVLLPDNLRLLIPGVVYIAFACVLLWVPGVSRWISDDAAATR